MRSWRYLLPLLVLGGLLAVFFVGLHQDPSRVPSPLIDKPAPPFDLPTLERTDPPQGPERVSLKSLEGRPVLINFFASWCVACRDEHDLLLELAHKDGVRIIGIDYKDEDSAAREWLAANGDPYALVLADHFGTTGINWGVYGVPETFVLDAHGVIRYKQIGPLTAGAYREHVAPLLREG